MDRPPAGNIGATMAGNTAPRSITDRSRAKSAEGELVSGKHASFDSSNPEDTGAFYALCEPAGHDYCYSYLNPRPSAHSGQSVPSVL